MLSILKFLLIPLIASGIALPLLFITVKKSWNLLKTVHPNVYFLGVVSCIMQIGATIVHSSGLEVMSKDSRMFSSEQFVIIKNLGDISGVPVRALSGYISDFIKNQKRFLMLGYGSMVVFKLLFLVVAMADLFPNNIFGLNKFTLLGVVFVVAHTLDRVFNSLRDAPRQKLINTTTTNENKFICFGIRKSIASIGSIIGAIFTFYMLENGKLNNIWPFSITIGGVTGAITSIHKMYFISIVIVSISVITLFMKIRNVNANFTTQNETENSSHKYWVCSIASVIAAITLLLFQRYYADILFSLKFTNIPIIAINAISLCLCAISFVFVKFTNIYTFIGTILMLIVSSLTSNTITVNYFFIFLKAMTLYFIIKRRSIDIRTSGFMFLSVGSMFLPKEFIVYSNLLGMISLLFSTIKMIKEQKMPDKLPESILVALSGFNMFDAIIMNKIVNKVNAYMTIGMGISIPLLRLIISTIKGFNISVELSYALELISYYLPISVAIVVPIVLLTLTRHKISQLVSISIFAGLLTINALNPVFGFSFAAITYVILNKINFEYIKATFAQNPNGNSYFYSIVGLACFTAVCRMNDFMFFKNFKHVLDYEYSSCLMFGLLYFWIMIFAVLYSVLLQKGYRKTLIFIVVGSLLSCNFICASNLHNSTGLINIFGLEMPVNFLAVNGILMSLGLFSAGDEAALGTLVQASVPNKKVYGTYFGIYDSLSATFKFFGTIVMNAIWIRNETLAPRSGITAVGRYNGILLTIGIMIACGYLMVNKLKGKSNGMENIEIKQTV